jgi:hypothetical protein
MAEGLFIPRTFEEGIMHLNSFVQRHKAAERSQGQETIAADWVDRSVAASLYQPEGEAQTSVSGSFANQEEDRGLPKGAQCSSEVPASSQTYFVCNAALQEEHASSEVSSGFLCMWRILPMRALYRKAASSCCLS